MRRVKEQKGLTDLSIRRRLREQADQLTRDLQDSTLTQKQRKRAEGKLAQLWKVEKLSRSGAA